MELRCKNKRCLNNRHGTCTLEQLFLDHNGWCKSFESAHNSMRHSYVLLQRRQGVMKQKEGKVLK